MAHDRLADVEGLLDNLYKRLAGEEKAKANSAEEERARIQNKIGDTWKDIRQYETEYAQRMSQAVRKAEEVPEAVAETAIAEIVDEVEILETRPLQPEVSELLQEILVELRKPTTPELPASAKLKVALPIIPKIVSYEIEGDTESVVRLLFPTFTRVLKGIRSQPGRHSIEGGKA